MISTSYTHNIKFKRKIYGIIGAFLTLVIPYYLYLHNANHHLDSEQSLCPFKMLTGFPCPGCGITKSMVYFYDGDFLKSLSYHIFGPFAIVFCIVTILVLSLELITQKEYFNNLVYNKKLAYALGIFLGSYHLIRLFIFIHQNTLHSILQQSIWQ